MFGTAEAPLALRWRLLQRKKAYCAKHPKEGRCNAESITVANTYMRTVTALAGAGDILYIVSSCWTPLVLSKVQSSKYLLVRVILRMAGNIDVLLS